MGAKKGAEATAKEAKSKAGEKAKKAKEATSKEMTSKSNEKAAKEAAMKARELERKAQDLKQQAKQAELDQKVSREKSVKKAQANADALAKQAKELSDKANLAKSDSRGETHTIGALRLAKNQAQTEGAADAWDKAGDLARKAAEMQQKFEVAQRAEVAGGKVYSAKIEHIASVRKKEQAERTER